MKKINDKHEDIMAKFGAILATGIIDAGGRNVTISLSSRSGHKNMVALIGLAIFSQYWYWHPLIHFISLAFTPTSIIGLNHDLKMPAFTFKSNARPSLFAYPPETKPPTVLVPTKVSTAILSTTRKAKARVPSKKGGLESSSLGASSLGTSDKMEIDVSKPKSEQDKLNDDKEKKGDEIKDEKVIEKKEDEEEKKKREEEEKKKKEEEDRKNEPRFEIKSNPSRTTLSQLKYLSFEVDPRYVPVKKGEAFGIVMLKDTKPGEKEEIISLSKNVVEEKEPYPPQPFEYP